MFGNFLLLSPAAVSAVAAAFLASLVEFVEALTIVLAVGSSRGWKWALSGTVAGVIFLTVLVAAFGPALQEIPLQTLQWVIGILLVLFGLRWLRKASLRFAGVIALHDEEKIFAEQTQALQTQQRGSSFDALAFFTSFKAIVLEGLEVVFIVIATGATTHSLGAATLGATAAGVLVILVGLAVHKPLSRVPENTLKWVVGLLLSAFGTFWIGEGLQVSWPGGDLCLLILLAAFALISLAGISLAKRRLA